MKNRFSKNYLISASAGLLAGLLMQPAAAAPLSLSAVPLIVAVSTDPNMMFLFDTSGSMNHIVVDTPYVASTTYGNCPSNKALGNSTTYYLVNSVSGGTNTAKIGNASGTPSWTNNSANKCFDPNLTYQASLIAPSDSGLAGALRTYPNSYSGNYLNWYFSNASQNGPATNLVSVTLNSSSTGYRRSDAKTRMEVAKTALSNLISNSLSHINVGLTIFDSSGSGARVVADLDKIDISANKNNLLTQLNGLGADGGTPLTSALAQIGRYFVKSDRAYTGDSPYVTEPAKIHDLFDKPPISGEASKDYITSSCQKSFIVTMTDGDPTGDSNYNSALGKWADNANSMTDDFDDVAAAMFAIDFNATGAGDNYKNNIINYTIGFELNTPLLQRAATLGGGKYFTVNNSTDLSKAFDAATNDIIAISGSMSSVAFNSSQLEAGSAIYQAKFDSGNWFGALEALPLDNQGVIGTASWEAGALLNSMTYTSRKIFTYDKTTLKDGIPFTWANMNTAQKDDFRQGVDSNGSGSVDDTDAQALLAYISGDRSKEGYNSTQYRYRNGVLGDLVDSSPIFVGKPQMSWPEYVDNNLFGNSSNSYSVYKNSTKATSRTPVVYIGGNDGMLHGFGAALTGTDAGKELFAYVPGLVYSNASKEGLHYLASQSYDHKFYVDLTPSVSDAFIKTAPTGTADWHTVLIGGLQAGGKGLFALDVSDPSLYSNPSNYAADVVLWEFDGSATSTGSADMGYVFGTPTVAMMANGKWAVISPNGYNSSNGHAVLLIIYLEGGLDGAWTATSDYIAIDTGVGSDNGLSTPRLVDFNGDKVVDMIYAGDLKGNMWAFDVSSTSSGSWTARKLFTAVNSDGVAQPITSGPVIALNPNAAITPSASNPNLLVMFGTGKYLETTDNTSTTKMSYYAVLDNGSSNLTRSSLEPRTVITDTGSTPNTRSVSGNAINWSTQSGWYIDLLDKTSASATPTALGERVVADSLLRRSVLFFNTIIVNSEDCTNSGSGWLMSLQYDTGLAPSFGVFDGNNSGAIDSSDIGFVGQKFSDGLPAKSGILGEKQYTPGTNGTIEDRKINVGAGSKEGRLSWHEIFRN